MSPEFPSNNPRAELEARLTAFILGELSAHEAAALRQAMEEDAELAALYERLKGASKLVREAAASPAVQTQEPAAPLKLSEERRQKLLAHFKTVAPKEFIQEKKRTGSGIRLLEIAAILAATGVLAGLLMPSLAKSKAKASRINVVNNLKQIELAKRMWADDNNKSPNDTPTVSDLASYLGGPDGNLVKSAAGETYTIGRVGESPTAELADRSRRISLYDNSVVTVTQTTSPPPPPSPAEAQIVGKMAALPQPTPATTIVLPPTASPTELAQNATATPNFGANFSSPGYVDSSANGNLGDAYGRTARANAGGEVGIAYAKPSDISTALTALGPQNFGTATGGSGGGAGNIAMADRGIAATNSRSQDFVNLSLSQQLKPGDIDPTTGLPIGPLPLNYSGPKIDPTTGLPVGPPTTGNRISDLQTRAYHVDSKDMQEAVEDVAGYGLKTADAPAAVTGPRIVTKSHDINEDVSKLYAAGGPELKDKSGKAIAYNERTGTLTVRGTPEDLELVDEVNRTLSNPPPEINIKAKFAEVTQDDSRALGFNFSTGNFTNGGSLIASGGPQPSFSGTNPPGNYPGFTTYRQLSQSDGLTSPQVTMESGRPADRVPLLGDMPVIGSLPRAGTGQTASPYTENKKVADPQAGLLPSQELIERIPAWHTNEVQTAITVQDGKLLLEAGKLDEAEAKLNEALRRDPGSVAANQYLKMVEAGKADPIRRSESHAGNPITPVEMAWDVEQRSGKLEPRPAPKTITNVWSTSGSLKGFYDDEPSVKAANAGSNLESVSVVGYVSVTANPGVPLLVSTNSVSTFDAAVGEAIRAEPDSIRYRFIATNGVISGKAHAATLDGVAVTVDPETKRVFYSTDEETSKQVAGIIQRLDKKGATEPTKGQSQAYGDKKKELESLRAAQESTALQLAEHGVEYKMPNTTMVGVIEHADGTPAKKTFGESIGHIFTGKEIQTARIKIGRDVTDAPGVSGQPATSGIYDPYFVQTESEVIQSEKILDRVVQQLGLKEVWGKKEGRGPLNAAEARAELKHSLEIKPARNTSLLDIKVKSGDAAEAAKIANTVAEVYLEYRKKQREELAQGNAKELKTELAEQQKKIARVEAELAQLTSAAEQADAPVIKHATNAPIPQPEVHTADNAFSTFSLNVADVSFKLAAASLEKGQMPEPASIRSEEFINAFDYRDPAPAAGAPLGFAWERAQYPFAHNRDLLRFSVKTAAAGREAGKPMNIVLLLDKSGSMERADRVRIVHEALRVLAGQLQPQDKLSVVTFARVARLWVDGLSGSQAGEVADGLDKLTPEGGTNLEEAMRLAYETARRHYLAGGINRVVLLTDGAANLGNVEPESLEQSVEAHRKEGIALDCFGVGWEGYDDDLLEALARHGDGRYGFLNTADDAANGFAKQLAGALHVAAADVKVQVEFNPKRVTAYRQIGYAKHQLTKEQFRDNTVDAAEIAAEESGNALYTIEVNPNGEGPLATVHVRYKVPGTQDYPERQWDVPYTGGATALDQSSTAMRLAGTASAFSEWLATSPFSGEVTMDKLLRLMSGVPETYGADERSKKLEWMIRQSKSLEGK